jgi:hypothetical protein
MSLKSKMILVGVHGRPSMKKVYGEMERGNLIVRRRLLKRNKVYYRTYANNNPDVMVKAYNAPDITNAVVIRWGTREELPASKNTIVYNRADAIAHATDKKLSREMMEGAGVRVPRRVNPELTKINYPVIARPRIHSKGKNFVVLRNLTELSSHYQTHERNGWYYSEYVKKDNEYRFHIGHGKILAMMEKTPPDNPNQLAWNRAINEDPFTYVNWDRLTDEKGLADAALESVKAVAALGLDFGGVDVMVKDNVAYVIEVNTAPTLNSSDYVASRWSKYMDWLLRSEKRRETFPTTEYKKPRNFIFFNEQLAQ